jgi:SAM-dependent methyltransferase
LRTSRCEIYESGPLRDVTGATIRPGGLPLTERAIDFCSFTAGAQLLDVGCGAGASVEHLCSRYGFDACGVDISPALIAEGLVRNPAMRLSEAPAEALPFADGSQDGILCECVLSILETPRAVLDEFQRVLRSGGYLILSDMYAREQAAAHEPDRCLRGVVTREKLQEWLSASGFATILWEDYTPILRELAARMILAGGSLEGFCCTTNGIGQRTGYYLLAARKEV